MVLSKIPISGEGHNFIGKKPDWLIGIMKE